VTPDDAVPFVCSLETGSLEERAGEWRAFVASSVASVEPRAASVRLVLTESESALVAAAALGQREKRCCAFFDVFIELGGDTRTLVLTVPDGAEEALATFVALLRS
jgi:hypothetical protein